MLENPITGHRSIIRVLMLFFIFYFYFNIYFYVLEDNTQQLMSDQWWILTHNNFDNIFIFLKWNKKHLIPYLNLNMSMVRYFIDKKCSCFLSRFWLVDAWPRPRFWLAGEPANQREEGGGLLRQPIRSEIKSTNTCLRW